MATVLAADGAGGGGLSPAYRDAYSRINALVVVGEGLADSHFRLLAGLLPEDGEDLLRVAARSWGSVRICSWPAGCLLHCITSSARRCAGG